MITIWTSTNKVKALGNLSPILKQTPGIPIHITQDYEVPEGTSLLLALGSHAFKKLQEEKTLAKNKSITSYRTIPQSRHSIPLLVSYSPDIGEIDHGHYVDLLTDMTLAVRFQQTGQWKPVYGNYQYVPDFLQLIAQIEAKHKAGVDAGGKGFVNLCKDLETVGLDPYALPHPPFPGAYIVTIQASAEPGTAHVVRFTSREEEEHRLHDPAFSEQVRFLLQCPYIKLRGANFKFDLHWLWKRGQQTCSNFTFDSTIVGSLLDENRSNSLNVHTKIYVPPLAGYDDEFNNTVDKSRMDKVPPETLLPYAGGDVDAGLQVAEAQRIELLKDPKLAGFYVNILHPAARAFEWIEQGGVLVDITEYQKLKAELEVEHAELVKKASKIMGGRIVIKHHDPSKPGGLNLTKASLINDFMFSPMGLNLKPKMYTPKPDKDGVKRPSTSGEHLSMFADHPDAKEFIAIIEEDSALLKTYGTYVVGFMEHIRSDGRFHPTYFLFVGNKEDDEGGARTGRLSAKAPAWQTVPKHTKYAKRIRKCFPAPPGYVIIERDYSQGELRVAACVANETNMIDAYRKGIDMHAKTAGPFRGYSYEQMLEMKKSPDAAIKEIFDAVRQLGKAGNFGLLFGMQAVPGFQNYARINYGVNLTSEEALTFRDGFMKDYPRLEPWHEESKQEVRKNKQVRTPLGRIRHLPLIDSPNQEFRSKAERQAINSPVQGTLTDMGLWAIAEEHKQGLTAIAPCFGMVHDSILNYAPEDQVDVLVPKMKGIMENLPFEKVGWNPQLKFPADAKIGSNMADLKEVK